MFNLPAILALAADTPAASAVDLSPETILIIQAAVSAMYDLDNWITDNSPMTDAEVEQIHDLVAQLEGECLP
jgi:hypothetical protein